MAIDVATEATPAESAGVPIELGPDLSIYPNLAQSAPDPSTEPTENAESDTPVTDQLDTDTSASVQDEPETQDPDAANSEPSRREQTRLLKAEEIEQIRAEERAKAEEALAAAQKAEADARQLQEIQAQQEARREELANTWGNAGNYARQLTDAIAEEDWATIDAVAAKFGMESPSATDARGLLKQLKEQHQRNGEMGDYWRQAFIGGTGQIMKKLHETKEGLDLSILMGGDPEKAWTHLYDAGAASKQGRIDALEAENKALRAKAGALSPSPESGGQGAAGNGWTPERYRAAVASGELDKMSSEERDRITQQLWQRDPRGR